MITLLSENSFSDSLVKAQLEDPECLTKVLICTALEDYGKINKKVRRSIEKSGGGQAGHCRQDDQ